MGRMCVWRGLIKCGWVGGGKWRGATLTVGRLEYFVSDTTRVRCKCNPRSTRASTHTQLLTASCICCSYFLSLSLYNASVVFAEARVVCCRSRIVAHHLHGPLQFSDSSWLLLQQMSLWRRRASRTCQCRQHHLHHAIEVVSCGRQGGSGEALKPKQKKGACCFFSARQQ